MLTVGPITLTLDVETGETDPAQATGGQSVAVQVQNTSAFVLSIVADGILQTIQAFTAATIAVSSQALQITPTQEPSPAAGFNTITLVWLLAGDKPPIPDGPLTSQAIAAAIAGDVSTTRSQVFIASGTVPATVGWTDYTVTLDPTWRSLYVGVRFGYTGKIEVVGTSGIFYQGYPVTWGPLGAVSEVPTIWRFPLFAGFDTSAIVSIQNGTTPDEYVIGADQDPSDIAVDPTPQPMAVQPIGGLTAKTGVYSDATLNTILSAPSAGYAYRLQRFAMASAPGQGFLTGVTSGANYSQVDGRSGSGTNPTAPSCDNLDGLLCTEALGVQAAGASSAWRYSLFYDVVLLPVT